MNIIKFNDTSFEVDSYSKNTYFTGENVTSNAYCSIKVTEMATLNALTEVPITSMEILHDGNSIYRLDNINAKIESINEVLNFDRINITVNFVFN